MRRALAAILALCVTGCGLFDIEVKEREKPKSPWMEPEVAPNMPSTVSTVVREPMQFTATEGKVGFDIVMDARTMHHSIGLDVVGIKIGDVPTLEYPVGFFKFDPESWSVDEQPGWARSIYRGFFRSHVGEDVQVSFDLQTIGHLDGRLLKEGDTATGTVIGAAQVAERQIILTFPTLFRRTSADTLQVTSVEPIEINLDDFYRSGRLGATLKAIGIGRIDPIIKATFDLELVKTDSEMPTFARTPVTVMSAVEVKKEMDASVDRYEAAMDVLDQTRLPGNGELKRETWDQMEAALKERTNTQTRSISKEDARKAGVRR